MNDRLAQVSLVRRCFTEAAVLRRVRRHWGRRARVVLLTASEGLAITTAVLSGKPHVRVVHEVRYREGRVLAMVERLLRRRADRVIQVCTAASVEAEVQAKAARTRTAVRPFSLKDRGAYVGDAERREARQRLGISASETVGCYLGGWWPGKDWHTAIAGISRRRDARTARRIAVRRRGRRRCSARSASSPSK